MWLDNNINLGRNMENLTELPTTARPSLLLLNEDCLLELFDFLKFEDSMNLAETCIYLSVVANRTLRKYSRMVLGRRTDKRKQRIYRFFTRFGHHVLSLKMSAPWGPLDRRIIRNSENLKRLEIHSVCGDFENGPSPFTIDNLEVLSFVDCDAECIKSFLNIVREVKALSIRWCQIECNALMNVLRNSPDMESFEWCWNGTYRFDFHLIEMISNVEKLSLHVELDNVSELDTLLKLNRLSKLILDCDNKSITRFLSELAKTGIIQELALINVAFDFKFLEMLKSFDSLQLLVLYDVYASFIHLKSSIVWPPKLKRFRFHGFTFTLEAFLLTIKQLKYLESICINHCRITEIEKDNFNDMTKLSKQILFAIDDSDRKQRLDVVLPWQLKFEKDASEEFFLDSERLRIFNGTSYNPLEIRINFPVV